jgi:hypothetical protein
LPFGEGERGCPGQRFAQVELVAAITALFLDGWRIEPVKETKGESMDAVRKRAKDIADDSIALLLIEMRNPEKVGLRWAKTSC